MSDEQELALVFPARSLADKLDARFAQRHHTAKIIRWAKKMTAEHAAASNDPAWWIASALRDLECLEAVESHVTRRHGGRDGDAVPDGQERSV